MPTTLATTSKATARKELAWRCSDWLNGTTTGAGTTTTAVDSAYVGIQADFFRGKYLLMTAGAAIGEWRRITDFTSSSGTYTLDRALSAASGTSNTYEVHIFRPDWYTMAVNEARLLAKNVVFRTVQQYLVSNEARDWYTIPRNMRELLHVRYGGIQKEKDRFGRAVSTTSPGGNWTATTGVWGITGADDGQLYSVNDNDADLVTQDLDMRDGFIQMRVRGTLNSGVTYRSPALVFRIAEDWEGNIDANNYLVVRLLNAVVELLKVDNGGGGSGVPTSLTTATTTTTDGTDYLIGVLFVGTRIRVWVDHQELLSYELVGPNYKFIDHPRVGIRLDKGGSPATAARINDYYAYQVHNLTDYSDWRESGDQFTLSLGALGRQGISDSYLIELEGRNILTALGEDTTYGTLATDGTATLEIATTDPAWEVFMKYAGALLYRVASQPHSELDPQQQGNYLAQSQAWMRDAEEAANRLAMPQPTIFAPWPS